MDVKEAVATAKNYVAEIFAGEPIANVGLEEVEFDDNSGIGSVTVGFSRRWNVASPFESLSGKRDYKIVRISDSDKKVLSVKNREPVG